MVPEHRYTASDQHEHATPPPTGMNTATPPPTGINSQAALTLSLSLTTGPLQLILYCVLKGQVRVSGIQGILEGIWCFRGKEGLRCSE